VGFVVGLGRGMEREVVAVNGGGPVATDRKGRQEWKNVAATNTMLVPTAPKSTWPTSNNADSPLKLLGPVGDSVTPGAAQRVRSQWLLRLEAPEYAKHIEITAEDD
jgi:hypothetical protein